MKAQSNYEMIDKLNHLLSDLQVFYINTKGLHWNIKGDKFFELHQKFEELYTDLNVRIDDVAERIVAMGGKPYHAYSDYLKISGIKESKEVSTPQKSVTNVVNSLEIIISNQKEILRLAHEKSDWGTIMLIGKDLQKKEKILWMFNAFNEKERSSVAQMTEAF